MSQNDFEPVDNRPVEVPTRLRLPQSRAAQMQQFIRQSLSRMSAEQGHESFEEADDIEPDDGDDMPLTRYELQEFDAIGSEQNPIAPASDAPAAEGGAKPAKPAPEAPPETTNGAK